MLGKAEGRRRRGRPLVTKVMRKEARHTHRQDRASFFMTFVTSGMSLAGSRQAGEAGRGYGDLATNIGSTNEKPFTSTISNQPTILIVF